MEKSSVKLLLQGVDVAIEHVRLTCTYVTGITLALPVDRKFTGEECGEIASSTSRHLKRSLTRRWWTRVKVVVRNKKEGAQRCVEVEIKNGFAPHSP